jgi:4-amino-4-deoxy-L-arabinose transferase-like glycosyltransferase
MLSLSERLGSRSASGLAFVLAVFIGLSCIYSAVTPLFEASGEPFSLRYALALAQTGQMPDVILPANWDQQTDAQQPPLYYALGSLFVHGIPNGALERLLQFNPYISFSSNDISANMNVLIHPLTGPDLPQVRSSVFMLRVLSLIASLVCLLFIFRISRILVPSRPTLHLAAVAITAFNPLFIVSSSAANNNALLFMWLTLAVYISLWIIHMRSINWRWFIALGLSVGLAALTSIGGLIGIILLPLAAFLSKTDDLLRQNGKRALLFFVSLLFALIVAGWWYGRNWVVLGQPIPLAYIQAITRIAPPIEAFGSFEQLFMYWGVFGWGNIHADQAYYTIAGILGILGVLGLLVQLVRILWERMDLQRTPWRVWLVALVWCLVVGGYSLFFKNIFQPQIVGLLALSSILAVVIPIGLRAWLPSHLGEISMWTMPGFLLVMAFIIPFHYIVPVYQPKPLLTLDQVPQTIRDVNLNYEDQLFLLGYEIPRDHVRAGESITLRLYWLSQQKIDLNYIVSIRIYGRDQSQIGGTETYPDNGRRATAFLVPGNVVVDEYTLHIDKDASTPTDAEIRVALFSTPQRRYLRVVDTQGHNLETNPIVARFAVVPLQNEQRTPDVKTDFNLGNKIQLLGYTLSSNELVPNGTWSITLFWRSIAPLSEDYTVFVHILDDKGVTITQVDEQPVNNHYPTSLWQTQDTILDTHTVVLPADLSPGSYTLSIGLYLLTTSQRLPVIGSSPLVNDVRLGPFSQAPK